jgi:RteC protein
MEQVFETVMKELAIELDKNERESNPLKRLSKNIELVKTAICNLFGDAGFNMSYSFEEDFQIRCNRQLLPQLFAKLLVFQKRYQWEDRQLYSTSESSRLFCERELETIHQFFTIHSSFCQYYHSGNMEDDWQLFTDLTPAEPDLAGGLPFRNQGCLLVAWILAYEEYGALQKEELTAPAERGPKQRKTKVSWNLPVTDLVEKVAGEYELGTTSFDGKPATLDALMATAEEYYGISLKNYKGHLQNIQTRKGGPATFHDKAKQALYKRTDELLEGKRRKRGLRSN